MCTQPIFICPKCSERLDGELDKCKLFGTKGHQPTFPRKILDDVNLCTTCQGHPELGATIRLATNKEIMSDTVARTRSSGGMNPLRPRYPKGDSEDIVVNTAGLLDGGESQKAKGGLQRLAGSLRRTKTDQAIQRGQENSVRQVGTDDIGDGDPSLGRILTRSMSLPSHMPRHHATSRDLETSTVNTKWKGSMTEDGKEMGKEQTIFEEPKSADIEWLNEYGEMTHPASVWVSMSEEEIDHDAKLSQGARKSSRASSYQRSEEQRVADMRRSKGSRTSEEIDHDVRWSQGTKRSSNTSKPRRLEDQRAVDIRRSKDSGMSDYSERSRINMRSSPDSRTSDERMERYSHEPRKSEEQRAELVRRSKDSRMSDESLRPSQVRIPAQKMAEELRIADEILARIRDGRGCQDCNVF